MIPWFADNPTLEFVAGAPVQATLGVINTDATPVNLTVIGGQLATSYDANLNVLNLTTNVRALQPRDRTGPDMPRTRAPAIAAERTPIGMPKEDGGSFLWLDSFPEGAMMRSAPGKHLYSIF